MKFCSYCNSWIDKKDFASHPTTYDRLQRICKECDRKRFREYYQRNKKKVLEKNKEWIENNRLRHNEIARICHANARNIDKEIN